MKVNVRLFAVARQRAGVSDLSVDLPEFATVADLRRALSTASPELAGVVPGAMIAVEAAYADDVDVIPEGADVALIPPVSGGGAPES